MELKVFLDAKTALLGFKDENDNIVIPAKYKSATEFSEGYAVVEYNKTYPGIGIEKGLINIKHTIAFLDEDGNKIDVDCERALPFLNGLSALKMNGKWGAINSNFRFVTKQDFNSPEDIKIFDLKTLTDLVQEIGVKVLNWADPAIFVSNENFEVLKTALKNHLKGLVPKIDVTKVGSEIEFTNLIQNEYDKLMQIRETKLKQVIRENKTEGHFFNMVDEMIK